MTIIPPILESFKKVTSSGYPILEFLNQYDRTGTRSYIDLPDDLQFLKRDGTVKATVTGTVRNTSTSWDRLYTILRANFDEGYGKGDVEATKKEEGVGISEYPTGMRVIGIEDAGSDAVTVRYEDFSGKKSSLEANLAIGDDGPNSFVRKLMLPEVRGLIPAMLPGEGH